MRAPALALALGATLTVSVAHAEPAHRAWEVSARTSYAYLGPARRPTGGMMISANFARSWKLGESSAVTLGAELTAFGFDAGGRWTAVLGGPVVSIRTRSWGPLHVGASVHFDAGRLPTCNPWGLCLQSSGFFPAASAMVRYAPSDRVSLDLVGGVRVVRTLPWSGAGGEGGLAATFPF